MKKMNAFKYGIVFIALCGIAIGCNAPAENKTTSAATTTGTDSPAVAKPADMAKLKMEIQALETSWAAADNARDTNTIAAFYADDAISLSNNEPMQKGKVEIVNGIKKGLAKRAKGTVVTYDVMDVFGDEQQATEIGTTTVKDAAGKTINTGKYMAIWEKRNGKYTCIRDIYNDDVKQK